jgi:DNA-binding transcriptional ArsR family regulator
MAMNDAYRALADPTRRAILHLLRERSMTAGEIAGSFPQAQSTVSGHLSVLLNAHLVVQERQGQRLVYHLNMSVLEDVVAALLTLTGKAGAAVEESL